VFVRFAVRREDGDDENDALAVHCVSLACLREGNDISSNSGPRVADVTLLVF
jgi:hypothetical protein